MDWPCRRGAVSHAKSRTKICFREEAVGFGCYPEALNNRVPKKYTSYNEIESYHPQVKILELRIRALFRS